MKNNRKYLCLLIAVVMMFSLLLTGCSDDNANDVTKPKESNTRVETTTVPAKVAMDTPDLAAYVQERTVTIHVTLADGTSTGSGFFIDDQGTLVTSYHVIDGAKDVSVQISSGATYAMLEIVDFSELLDLAVVKVDVTGNDFLEIAEEEARTGENVYAVGSSLGFLEGTFSNGIVSNASRKVGQIPCIQTTAAISNGNSGGPLVNQYGEVVGINAFSYTDGENLNLAVKIDNLNALTMDKNWSINKYREWFDKETSRSFVFYDYNAGEYIVSKVNTYQYVTGTECLGSALNWDFLEGDFEYVVDGYHTDYGLFFYEYDVSDFDKYTEYLGTVGFEYDSQETYTEGVSYYYINSFTGMQIDIFILEGDELVVIEPYC